ncbi:MAG: alpha/beta fold hydrolase [Rhodobacteraceae bacterium]|nr:alpha/beta fold hydrolase [Paracoccaceae bacterium]
MLNVIENGSDRERPPLLIAHGLFGSARNWGVIARRLSAERTVLTVDMRNHGTSPWAESHGYADLAADLAEVIEHYGGRADVVGHSMGGKAAMALTLLYPRLVDRLVVADIAPVAYDHSQSHLIEAMRGVDLGPLDKRSDADAMLRAHIGEPGVRAFLLQSLDLKEKRWRLNLDVLETEMDRITGWQPIEAQAGHRTLFLAGADSDYVRPESRPDIKRLFATARFARLPGAGHWLHADKPRQFEAAVAAFLNA